MSDGFPTIDPVLAQRLRNALRAHEGSPEVAEARELIETAHAQLAASQRDPSVRLDHPELSWAKTHLEGIDATRLGRVDRRVTSSGELIGLEKYEMLDPGWLETLAEYLEHILVRPAKFGKHPVEIPIAGKVSLAIAGDWGTGFWEGAATAASKVAEQMKAADYAIHLGDTYYAGTRDQVGKNLATLWPLRGTASSFAIPGNHEMYCKGRPYRRALADFCPAQRKTSFFAMRNEHWLVLALDSAYFAKRMYLEGTLGPAGNAQREFVKSQLAARRDRRVILLTHHTPFDLARAKPHGLGDEVMQLFGESGLPDGPVYWAWGHLHNTAVYSSSAASYLGRLIGHGAIPFGNARELGGNPMIRWYETASAGDPKYPERVMNGFLRLELEGAECRETLIAEDGTARWSGSF